jgi:hypothetical protein
MKFTKPNAPYGPPAGSIKQRKQQALSWMLHQTMGAQGNLGAGFQRQVLLPPSVVLHVSDIKIQLRLLEDEIRNELRNIK